MCYTSVVKLSDKQKMFLVFITLYMGGNGLSFCEDWVDVITVAPCLGFMGFIVGVVLLGLASCVSRLGKLFQKARM